MSRVELNTNDLIKGYEICPQEGAQREFLKSTADIAIYGGSAGSGKTMALLLEPLYYIQTVENFNALFLRRTYPEITNPGGLWDESKKIYSRLGATSSYLTWKFPLLHDPSKYNTITFSHMTNEETKYKYQGSQITLICFDELTMFSQEMFTYMLSRNRSVCGVKPYIRATTNPDPDSWVKQLISWWLDPETGFPIKERSGVLRYFIRFSGEFFFGDTKEELLKKFPDYKETEIKSLTFIPATVYDNKILLKTNPDYLANLKALDDYERALFLEGNWNAKKNIGSIFGQTKFTQRKDFSTWAYLDPAYSGSHNTSISIGYIEDGNFIIKGFTWRESIVDIYDEILVILGEHACTRFFIERNADKSLGAYEFQRRIKSEIDKFPSEVAITISNMSIITHHESENKNVRILHYVKRNWEKIFFTFCCDKIYLNNVICYEENTYPDDEADSLAGLIKMFTLHRRNNMVVKTIRL